MDEIMQDILKNSKEFKKELHQQEEESNQINLFNQNRNKM